MRRLVSVTRVTEDENKNKDSDIIILAFDQVEDRRINIIMSVKFFREIQTVIANFEVGE